MQSDSTDQETRIFIKATADMRSSLERLMGLKPFQILKATKPAFGSLEVPSASTRPVCLCELSRGIPGGL